ncbi:hypothetical protein CDAR_493831 [Caerostris darwini]|uniref:Uncharacterized protein n=1 Tax=Caerostris darwini TaxID=1538125 RepID=A0AAV4VU10_9ARAC|nr:hypothetical protein CDAR_493831 [Caerostris darwini]
MPDSNSSETDLPRRERAARPWRSETRYELMRSLPSAEEVSPTVTVTNHCRPWTLSLCCRCFSFVNDTTRVVKGWNAVDVLEKKNLIQK